MRHLTFRITGRILPLLVILLTSLGCSSAYRGDMREHPKIVAIRKLIKAMRGNVPGGTVNATYLVAVDPVPVFLYATTIEGTDDGCRYSIFCSPKTIARACSATLVEALVGDGKEPRFGMEFYSWDNGRWTDSMHFLVSKSGNIPPLDGPNPREIGPAQPDPDMLVGAIDLFRTRDPNFLQQPDDEFETAVSSFKRFLEDNRSYREIDRSIIEGAIDMIRAARKRAVAHGTTWPHG